MSCRWCFGLALFGWHRGCCVPCSTGRWSQAQAIELGVRCVAEADKMYASASESSTVGL